MKYVSEGSAYMASEFARRLQELPASAGIIFVSVSAVPVEGGQTMTFDVCLGMSQQFDPSLGASLTKKVFEKELEKRLIEIRTVSVFSGVSGAAVDRGY